LAAQVSVLKMPERSQVIIRSLCCRFAFVPAGWEPP